MNLKQIMKLDLRNPKTRTIVAIVGLGIAGAIAWHPLINQPKQATLKQLSEEEMRKQSELNSILAMKPQLNKLTEDIERASHRLDSLKSIFPDQKEIPKLIQEITKVADAAGIETRKFSPQPDVEREYYMENRYDMSVVGGYHQLANFFAFLANLQLLINIGDVTLNVNPDVARQLTIAEEEGQAPMSVVATFRLTTFSSRR
jgi:type IV pilus assembly protein PilO